MKGLSQRGRRVLRGPRRTVRHRGIAKKVTPEPEPVIYIGNTALTGPEARIYQALTEMQIAFEPQAVLGGGRQLGGAIVDFLLVQQGIALEYQGPFHETNEGHYRDLMREANRSAYGYRTEYVHEHDLDRIHSRLKEIIGVSTRRLAR